MIKAPTSCRSVKKYGFNQQKPSTGFGAYNSDTLEEKDFGTETEAEKQMKLLLEKQLNTKMTLKEYLAQQRHFVNSSTYTPLTELVQGTCSLKKYKEIEDKEEKYQELQRSGLTEDEINFYFTHRNSITPSRKRVFPIDPLIEDEKLQRIKEKISAHQEQLHAPDICTGVKTLSRHAMDIEKTLYVGCNQKKQLSHLVTENERRDLLDGDPFKHVKDLSEKLIQNVHKKRKQKKQELIAEQCTDRVPETQSNCLIYNPSIHHVIVPLEEKEVIANRLSIDEIKKIPRFEKYSPGIPNRVLYLKNLHPKVTIRDLQCLFNRFQVENDDYIEYRILSGRMKGQAFVTFPDIKYAEEALQFINGYVLRERPVIIEYGKKS